MADRRLYTTTEACAHLRVSKHTLYRMEIAGTITSIQYTPGGKKLWPAAIIDRLSDPAPRKRNAPLPPWRKKTA